MGISTLDAHRQAYVNITGFKVSSIGSMNRFRAAMILAVVADLLQLAVFPLFVEGAESPAEDALDLGIGATMIYLLGWHWEFAPSFLGKLVPGMDLVPFWTMAVANVYRKAKQAAIAAEQGARGGQTLDGTDHS